MEKRVERRVVWVDVVRVFAIWTVVACHCGENATLATRLEEPYFTWGNLFACFTRFCVPLFAMVTGYLLLPVKAELLPFYRKRLPRILVPLFFWGVIHCFFAWGVSLLGGTAETVQHFFLWIDAADLSFSAGLKLVAQLAINFNAYCVQLWYLYMLAGIYLILPIFSAWLEQVSMKSKLTLLGVWAFSLFIPFIRALNPLAWPAGDYVFGACSWNEFHTFYYISGFIGYVLLGYLIGHMKNLSWSKTLLLSLPAFIVGWLVTWYGFRWTLMLTPDLAVEGSLPLFRYPHEEQTELFYTFCSPQVALMSGAMMLFLKKLSSAVGAWLDSASISRAPVEKFIGSLARCSFGVYLTHYFFLSPILEKVMLLGLPLFINLVIGSTLVFLATSVFVFLLSKLPKSNWIIG